METAPEPSSQAKNKRLKFSKNLRLNPNMTPNLLKVFFGEEFYSSFGAPFLASLEDKPKGAHRFYTSTTFGKIITHYFPFFKDQFLTTNFRYLSSVAKSFEGMVASGGDQSWKDNVFSCRYVKHLDLILLELLDLESSKLQLHRSG